MFEVYEKIQKLTLFIYYISKKIVKIDYPALI